MKLLVRLPSPVFKWHALCQFCFPTSLLIPAHPRHRSLIHSSLWSCPQSLSILHCFEYSSQRQSTITVRLLLRYIIWFVRRRRRMCVRQLRLWPERWLREHPRVVRVRVSVRIHGRWNCVHVNLSRADNDTGSDNNNWWVVHSHINDRVYTRLFVQVALFMFITHLRNVDKHICALTVTVAVVVIPCICSCRLGQMSNETVHGNSPEGLFESSRLSSKSYPITPRRRKSNKLNQQLGLNNYRVTKYLCK